jgi:YHS domain-containing protein
MTAKTKLLCIATLAFAAACGGGAPPAPGAPTTETGTVKPAGEAKVGEKTTCPVMKDTFVVTEKSPKVEYKGKTYYFCCEDCVGKFKADPEKYLTPGGT